MVVTYSPVQKMLHGTWCINTFLLSWIQRLTTFVCYMCFTILVYYMCFNNLNQEALKMAEKSFSIHQKQRSKQERMFDNGHICVG